MDRLVAVLVRRCHCLDAKTFVSGGRPYRACMVPEQKINVLSLSCTLADQNSESLRSIPSRTCVANGEPKDVPTMKDVSVLTHSHTHTHSHHASG